MDSHIERRRQDEMNTIAEQAAAWLLELETPDRQCETAFRKWITESPLHVEAFLWASAMDRLLKHVDPEREIEIEGLPPENVVPLQREAVPAHESPRLKEWFAPRRWAAAAAVVGVLAGVWWAASSSSGWRSYSTAVGEQRSVALADGSKVHINTSSRIDVRLSNQGRDVRLRAGEALFDVQHDPARPFRVHSAGAVVQAVGTQFNVHRRAANTTVSVVEGRVSITPETPSETQPGAGPVAHTLAAGEQANVATNGKIVKRARVDVVRVAAWRQRRLVFANDTLADMATEFNRYNETLQIRVEGEDARARRYAAGFDADDPESLALFLARDPTLEVEKKSGELVIRAR